MNEDPRSGFAFYVKSPSGIETALHVTTGDLVHVAALVEGMKEADRLLKAAGFVRSDRLDKPVYQRGGGGGGRAARPETPPPADLEVPEHCGQPMVYMPGGKRQDGSDYSPRWVCRAGSACEEKDAQGRPHANWRMKKKPDAAAAKDGKDAGGSEAQGSATPPQPMGYGQLLNIALADYKLTKQKLIELAGLRDEAELKALGPEGWQQIADELAKAKATGGIAA